MQPINELRYMIKSIHLSVEGGKSITIFYNYFNTRVIQDNFLVQLEIKQGNMELDIFIAR